MSYVIITMKKFIGAHVSTAGGTEKAMARAAALGANCIQIFSGSPRFWKRSPLAQLNVDIVSSEQKKYGVEKIFIHALYLANLATDKPELAEKSVAALIYDLGFASRIGASGVVVHIGSHQGRGWAAVRELIAMRLGKILAATPTDSVLLIENSAGQKGKVNSDLAEIRWLLDQVDSPRLGWCLDTCHAFSAGYGFTPDQTGQELLSQAIAKYKLWPSLKMIHVNESKGRLGGGIDRHANLGEGLITDSGLKRFLGEPEVQSIPLILEVPGRDGNGPDKPNLDRLKALVN